MSLSKDEPSVAAFSAIVILIRGIWPQSTSSDPLICNLSELAGVDELTSKTQSDSLTPLSGQILFDSQSEADAVLQEETGGNVAQHHGDIKRSVLSVQLLPRISLIS